MKVALATALKMPSISLAAPPMETAVGTIDCREATQEGLYLKYS